MIADIADAKARGARAIFFVDDNITLDVPRFEALCQAIIDAGLDDIDYIVQGMTSPIASRGDALASLMKRAGFRYVFLGIENVLDDDLAFLKARAKNSKARTRDARLATPAIDAIETPSPPRPVRGRRTRSSATRTTRARRSTPTSRSRSGTWTGPTFSTPRRIRARR